MELFAYTVELDDIGDLVPVGTGNSPTSNFDEFYNAFITVFIVLTGEDWNKIYYVYARDNYWVSTVFFYSLIIFGQLILLNLFLAILLDNFDEVVEEEEKIQKKKMKIVQKTKIQHAITLKFLKTFMESKEPKLQDVKMRIRSHSSKKLKNFNVPNKKPSNKFRKMEKSESDFFDSIDEVDESNHKMCDSPIGDFKKLDETIEEIKTKEIDRNYDDKSDVTIDKPVTKIKKMNTMKKVGFGEESNDHSLKKFGFGDRLNDHSLKKTMSIQPPKILISSQMKNKPNFVVSLTF